MQREAKVWTLMVTVNGNRSDSALQSFPSGSPPAPRAAASTRAVLPFPLS